MDIYSFDYLCNSQEFEHNAEFILFADMVKELVARQEIIEANKAQLTRMAHWIIDTVESELDAEECHDDCAYQDALEILGMEKKDGI